MISREEAERVAAVWARRASRLRGYECVPMLSEFDLGYVVWQKQPAEVTVAPGDLTTTVIDRETGEISNWPAVPPHVVQDMYRRRRAEQPATIHTADPAVELRRVATRVPTPTTVAHLTVDGEQFLARGAKGDQELHHHRLVRDHLDRLPAGHLVRGGDRHAELLAVSDALHEHDRRRAAAGQPPLNLEEARALLHEAPLIAYRVREPGDPEGGQPARPCESCLHALVHFAVLSWPILAFAEEWRPRPPEQIPHTGRFPDEVAAALVDAGWQPGPGDWALAAAWMARVTAVSGAEYEHEAFPMAERVITAFPNLGIRRQGPGEQVWIRRMRIKASAAAYSADSLGDLARVIGAQLFPIGTEDGDSILAVDEYGRIFALDQAGEWFIGPDIDTALTNLLLGRAPSRIRDDGSW